MQRLATDTSSFRRIRKENKLYVDKTRWIYRLITENTCYFLPRPGRFGKFLTINTLKELFLRNKELFQGLYIYDKWEFEKYPVIVFDFNEITHSTPETFVKALRNEVLDFAESYGVPIKEKEDISKAFRELIERLYEKFKKSVVVLVDEYDKPIIDHLALDEERLEIARKNREIIKEFFGVLKGKSVVDILKFVFVTGASVFTKFQFSQSGII